MTKHIKRRPGRIAPAAETRSDPTGADNDQANTVDTPRRHLGITLKQPLLHGVSAVERLRIWLLKQAWFHSMLLPRSRASCAGSCAGCTWHQWTSLTD